MQVDILDGPDPLCDAFVSRTPGSRLAHLPAWGRMVQRVFGHRPYYLVARGQDGQDIEGVLPLTHVKTWLTGSVLVSQAFIDYGSILAANDSARDALYHRAVELAGELGCESVEFRNIDPLPYEGLARRDDKVTLLIPLEDGVEAVWMSFGASVRKQTRKAEKHGLTAQIGGAELLNDFYSIYCRKMHELGTPAYPRKMMQAMCETFPGMVDLFRVRLEDVTVAAGLMTFFNGIAEIPWSGTLDQYDHLYPNRLLYWTMIEHYTKKGAHLFDFGRSSVGGGNYEFKLRWHAHPVPLNYQYWLRPGKELSVLSPDNPRFRRKVEMWKKLPFRVARALGPIIARQLP